MTASRLVLPLALALGVLAAPPALEAQPAGRVYRIGYLAAGGASATGPIVDAFRHGLRDLGYVEGKNLVIDFRFAEGRYERLPDLAAELVRLPVDVIFAAILPAALAARSVTRTIPIVTAAATDPVESGLVTSLARPGGNVTGLATTGGPEIAGKRLQLLKETIPRITRVAVLSNPGHQAHPGLLKETQAAARSLRIRLQLLQAQGPDEFDRVFAAMIQERAEALVILPDAMFFAQRRRLADLETRSRLPAIHGFRDHAQAGSLMSYAASLPDLWRRAATYVDKVLKGANPADLPMAQPTRFDLVVNLKTAKTLGLKVPPSVLARADTTIE